MRRNVTTARVRAGAFGTASPWRIVAQSLGIAVGVVMVAVIAALLVVPKVTGGASLTVLSGSMEPNLMPGDIVVVRGIATSDVCSAVQIGDIVTYFPEANNPDLITHRVVGKNVGNFDDGTDCRLTVQGDNNSAVDDPVSPEQVRGVFLYGVPKLGWARQWVSQNPQMVAYIAGGLVVAYLLWSTFLAKPKTRVIGLAGPGDPEPATAIARPTPPADPGLDPEFEREMRAREIACREREVACREAEVAVRQAELALGGSAPVPVTTQPPLLTPAES